MKKPTLYILCGPSGSGKSTFASNFTNEHTIWVSRDAIRFRYLDNDPEADYFAYEKEAFNDYIKEIVNALINNYNVIADATHLNVKSRKKLTNAIDNYFSEYDIIYIVFCAGLDKCIERNNLRYGRTHVPEEVIKNMNGSFTIPNREDLREIGMWTIEGEV